MINTPLQASRGQCPSKEEINDTQSRWASQRMFCLKTKYIGNRQISEDKVKKGAVPGMDCQGQLAVVGRLTCENDQSVWPPSGRHV